MTRPMRSVDHRSITSVQESFDVGFRGNHPSHIEAPTDGHTRAMSDLLNKDQQQRFKETQAQHSERFTPHNGMKFHQGDRYLKVLNTDGEMCRMAIWRYEGEQRLVGTFYCHRTDLAEFFIQGKAGVSLESYR